MCETKQSRVAKASLLWQMNVAPTEVAVPTLGKKTKLGLVNCVALMEVSIKVNFKDKFGLDKPFEARTMLGKGDYTILLNDTALLKNSDSQL